ncbi:MAG: LysM peptidoglycan-binding domain-containing protein [Cyanobacteria bacterium SZAS LIN-2]|nr:LysM peptidoglycan-binding domain-containing protein [Cyanobacteria bacterium SZAS LIN-2]
MPIDRPLAAEGNPDALHNVESFRAPADHVSSSIQAQLSNPSDIASANQFFKPTGAEQFLPTVGNVGPHGIELGAMAPAPHYGVPPMTGLETHGIQAVAMPPGGEMAALSGAPGVMPGAEQLSPLINMIMKMPGHIGLASSFFEALGAFFAPAQEMLGNLAEGIQGFDLGGLFEHAGDAGEALGSSLGEALEGGADGAAADLSLLPTDAPIFDHISGGGDFSPTGGDLRSHLLGDGSPDLADSFASAPRLEVGGGPSHPIFEMGPGAQGLNFDNNNYLAMEPNQGFGATTGNFSTTPQPMPAPTTVQSTVDWQREALHSGSARSHLMGDGAATTSGAGAGGEGQFNTADGQGAQAGDRVAEAQTEAPQHTTYTVHKGDNLWDIARSHLGDGTRWEEIYDLNKSVLGDNPRLIMPGTELQLPGGDSIADASMGQTDYTVKAGDNLWDISRDHLGGGQNWHELYQHNHDVVGSNPDLIHPGQHLQLDAGGHAAAGHDVGHSLAHNGGHNLHHGAGHHMTAHNSHTVAHHAAAAHPTAAPQAGSGAELQAKPQSLSSIQSYGEVHDSATSVPNSQL